jgi:hypothetical protein
VEVKTDGNEGFDVQWETLEKGRRYKVSVTPSDLKKQKTTRITLVTDFPSPDNPLTYDLRATVQPKLAPQPERPSALMGMLQTSEGILAVGGMVLALVVGAISIVLVLRTPKGSAKGKGESE